MPQISQLSCQLNQLSIKQNDIDGPSNGLESSQAAAFNVPKRRRKKHKKIKGQLPASDSHTVHNPLSPSVTSVTNPTPQIIVPYTESTELDLTDTCLRLRPRGFMNFKNCCYLNVSLQTLLHCTPLVRLFRYREQASERTRSLFPETGSLSKLMLELYLKFVPLCASARPGTNAFSCSTLTTSGIQSGQNRDQTTNGDGSAPSGIFQYELGPTLCAYREFASVLKLDGGFQEDGAECLTRLLSQLHEEFGKCNDATETSSPNPPNEFDDDSSDWMVADRRGNHHPEARKTELYGGTSVISDLFAGFLVTRSVLNRGRMPSRSGLPRIQCPSLLEPFFMLPLEIADPSTTSIESALLHLGETELIADYHDDMTDTVVPVRRRVCIDKLPPLLILQLKRFSCTPSNRKERFNFEKSTKQIAVPVDLTIPTKILNSATVFPLSQRRYTLHAVIFHIGQSASSGHYTVAIRWGPCSVSCPTHLEFLYLDDTVACLLRGEGPIRTLLQSHCPLDTIKCQFRPQPSCSSPNGFLLQQPRTPYILVYGANDFLCSQCEQ